MYMTLVAGSPCVKTVSFPADLDSFLPSPAESRNSLTSNAGILEFALGEERRALLSTRRTAEDTMHQNSTTRADCPIQDSPCRPTPRPHLKLVQQVLRIHSIAAGKG